MCWYWRENKVGRRVPAALLLLTLATVTAALAGASPAEEIVLPSDGVLLREGAGNYYPIIEVLPAGTSLTQTGAVRGWLDVLLRRETRGWISASVLVAAAQGLTDIPKAAAAEPVRKVNLAAIGAMIKGLGQQIGTDTTEASALLVDMPVDTASARSFRVAFSLPPTDEGQNGESGDTNMLPEYLALSPVLAAQIIDEWGGPSDELLEYGNLILLWLADRANASNLAPSLQVTKEGSNSVSLPGGWIILGGDLVGLCQDESELAAVIAHELSHAIHHHSYEALRQEEWRLRADAAFAQLHETTGQDPAQDFPEIAYLEAYGTSVLQQARRRHDLPMELAADATAVNLLYRSGYDPAGLLRLLERMRGRFGDRMTGNGSVSIAWLNSRDELDKRVEALREHLAKMDRRILAELAVSGRFEARFRSYLE